MPREPPPSPYAPGLAAALDRLRGAAPTADDDPGDELAGSGGDLEPGTLLAAYRLGLFPMGFGPHGGDPMGWWCPARRGVLALADLHVSRSLRRSTARFDVRVDHDFDAVVARCADPSRRGRWITPAVSAAYGRLHRLGWAHSVETWHDGELVGGLYGVAVGGLFAGESMFSTATDASKAALVALVGLLADDGDPRRLLDVQWRTPHLATLGVSEVGREEYLERLARALQAPTPPALRRAETA